LFIQYFLEVTIKILVAFKTILPPRSYSCCPDWNLSTFSTRSCPCSKKNQACKWNSHAWWISACNSNACSIQYMR